MVIRSKKSTFQLLMLMILVSLVVTGVSIIILYRVVYSEKKEYLKELSQSQVGIIKSIYHGTNSSAEVLRLLKNQQKYNNILGESGEFFIACLKNDSVFFLMNHIRSDFARPRPIALSSNLGVPVKYALQGNTGFIKGPDYSGKKVLAYCNYIPELKWGSVTKIDISEVNKPFYHAGIIALILTILLITSATFVFRKISEPIVEAIMESERRYHNLFEFSAVPVWEEDFSKVNDYLNQLRQAGVSNFRDYFERNREEVNHVASLIQIVDANQKSLEFLNLSSKEEVMSHLFYFDDASLDAFKEEIITLAEGNNHFECEMPLHVSNESTKHLLFHLSVMPGHYKPSRVLVSIADITERKQFEEKLRQSEENFRAILEATKESIYLFDRQGVIVAANTTAARRLNLSREDIIGHDFREFVPEKLIPSREKYLEQVFVTREPLEFMDERNNLTFEHHFYPFIKNDEVVYVATFSRDITERRKIEERIRQSEQRLRLHIDNSPLAIVEWDSDFIVTQWSGEADKIFGWRSEETLGKRIDKLNLIYEEDIPIVEQTMVRLTSGKEATVISSNRNYTKAGNIIECTWYNSVLYDKNGKMESVLSLVLDITEQTNAERNLRESKERLAESEEKYRLLFNTMIDGFALNEIITASDGTPVDYRFISVNPAFEELMKLKASKIIGRTALQVSPGMDQDLIRIYGNVALTGQNAEFESFQADLNKYFKVSAFCPKPGYFAVILEDITQQIMMEEAKKKAEKQLKQYATNLKELNATKDKFFGIIAHDLKNPFASLLGASEVLLNYIDKFDVDNIKSISRLLNDSAQKGFSLLENLLEWARSQTGALQFKPQKENIADLILVNLSHMEVMVLDKEITLLSDVDPCLEAEVDKNMFNTIIRNLLHNAIKFTRQGGTVSVLSQKSKTFFTITIQDTGIGMTESDIGKLFKLDTQYTKVGTAHEKGTGLGLLLCKEFVEKHGGRIWAESRLGEGSEFKFTIPYVSHVRNPRHQAITSNLTE